MARSIIDYQTWEKAKEYFEVGLSLSEIEKKTGISRGALSKKSQLESWNKQSIKKQLVAQAIAVEKGKETLKKHPVSLEVHNEIVSESVRIASKVYSAQEKALDKADIMLDQIDSASDLKTIVDAIDRASITLKVSDRHASSQNINVNATAEVQNNIVKSIDDFYETMI